MIQHSILNRRRFLASAGALLTWGFASAAPAWARPRRARATDHPTPRPGITAANVLPDSALTEYPGCQSAFEAVRKIPQIVDGIRCQCGCADIAGFYSLLSCYESAGMARICPICQGEARLAYRLFQSGKTLEEIRTAIDARFG